VWGSCRRVRVGCTPLNRDHYPLSHITTIITILDKTSPKHSTVRTHATTISLDSTVLPHAHARTHVQSSDQQRHGDRHGEAAMSSISVVTSFVRERISSD
jgi:hypothetical protein